MGELVMAIKVISCTWCSWKLATQQINEAVKQVTDGHIQYHVNQTIADIESYLETAEEGK